MEFIPDESKTAKNVTAVGINSILDQLSRIMAQGIYKRSIATTRPWSVYSCFETTPSKENS